MAQVFARARHVMYMVIHVVRLSVDWLSVPILGPFRVSLLSLTHLFPLLPGPWLDPLPPWGRRQGNHTGTPSTEESGLGPWPKRPLSHFHNYTFESPHYWSVIQTGVIVSDVNYFASLLCLGITLWSVINPLTLFKIRILERVTGWGKIYFLQRRGTIVTTF